MKPLHLAIGIFDGVHRGHRFLLGEAIKNARNADHISGALTFHPHPKQVLQLPHAPQLIYPIAHRYWLLKKQSCDAVFIKKFTLAWARFTPERFFEYLHRLFPHLTAIYVGEDFHFGHQRSGDTHLLEALCQVHREIQPHVFQRLTYQGRPICSSRIRIALQQGSLQEANTMLGDPYHSIGFVDEKNQFHHHCELKPNDGHYTCRLRNKQDETQVQTQVLFGQFFIRTPLPAHFYHKACCMEFLSNR